MVVISEIFKGSSSSSSNDHNYDVFLSFRGVDTRYGFTGHLYKALQDANISTFLDDEEIETGGDLKPELESAIKASRASIIVLSKNYANSSWCLDELVLILAQHMTSNHIVIPIFYHVEPTHIRKQESTFGLSMAGHKDKVEAETNANKRSQLAQKIDRWIKALTKVANLKGETANGRKETEFIEEIVKDIYHRLRISSRVPLPQLIGMDYSKKFVTSWLNDASSHTADILTLLGMSGIGKTSLAKYAYGLHSHEFDTCSFIEDISRTWDEKHDGELDLQKKLYDDISKPSSVQVHDGSTYTSMIENALARKKVFLVLDDIDSTDQLNALLGSKGFYPGSKIIITTKDSWLTGSCTLLKANINPKHKEHLLQGLHMDESRQLLCFHAFTCNHPKAGYEEVLERLVKYCEGHPLALEVLGKSLINREVAYWEKCIERLKKDTNSRINKVLRMSFDSLPHEDDKKLFKHIACFFVGTNKDVTETILKACDIETSSGITSLTDRCLVTIGCNKNVMMHRLLQDMGRLLVREESRNFPGERSLIWSNEESFKVLKQKKGTEKVLGLTLDMRMLEKEKLSGSFELKTDALSNMVNLMLLQLNYVQIKGTYENFPEDLRWLCMHGFPLKSIPADLPMENLVALDMSYSKIESFVNFYSNPQRLIHKWIKRLFGSCLKDKRLLGSLKILNLSFCEKLHSLGGFHELPSLERLIVRNCIRLVKICESIKTCVKLVHIDLRYCIKLESFPRTMDKLEKVKTLLLDGCNLDESIRDMDSSEKLMANNIGIKTIISSYDVPKAIPSNVKFFTISLPRSLVRLSLAKNNLSTESFPMDFSYLSMLKELYLDDNPIVSLPICVRSLPRLMTLSLTECYRLKSVEYPPRTLTYLDLSCGNVSLVEKVVFDPEMSPLELLINWDELPPSSIEFEGMIKSQPISGVEEKVLRSLGWKKLDFLNQRCLRTSFWSEGYGDEIVYTPFEIQMYYEFGIFSTMYGGKEMPNWVRRRRKGPSISFSIPLSSKHIKGLNFCSVHMLQFPDMSFGLPKIIIRNMTKNRAWIYEPYVHNVSVGGHYFTMLSHWMLGMNEIERGDQVIITSVGRPYNMNKQVTEECGVSFVYDDGKTDEKDALAYYKSWNHIIGGDLSGFQTTTGDYILDNQRFEMDSVEVGLHDREFVGDGAKYKEYKVHFRAFSQRKSCILGDTLEEEDNGGTLLLTGDGECCLGNSKDQSYREMEFVSHKRHKSIRNVLKM